jgi:MFS family permease
MRFTRPDVEALCSLTPDGRMLVLTRVVRLFAYGCLSVVFALYLAELELTDQQIGLVLTLTLVGDAVLSLWIATEADHLGRRRMLIPGAGLTVFAGFVFRVPSNLILLPTAFIGTMSPSGGEVGPFLSIEQAALSQTTTADHRTHVFAWYNLVGWFAAALGAFSGGAFTQTLRHPASMPITSYRVILMGYAGFGALLGWLFTRVSPAVEVIPIANTPAKHWLGLHRSHAAVFKLSVLFMRASASSRPCWGASSSAPMSLPAFRRSWRPALPLVSG